MKHLMIAILFCLLIPLTVISNVPIHAQNNAGEDNVVLEHHAGTWWEIIRDLEKLGFIPSGGELHFTDDYVSVVGPGTPFQRFTTESKDINFVMGGQLRLSSDGPEMKNCALFAHVTLEGSVEYQYGLGWRTEKVSVESYAGIGIFHSEDDVGLVALDWHTSKRRDTSSTLMYPDIDFDQTVNLVLVGLEDKLTVFANGKEVLSDWDLRPIAGSYILSLVADDNSRCEGLNLWGYGLPDTPLMDSCGIEATGIANKRSGPGTTFEIVGQTTSGDTSSIAEQAEDDAGFMWLHLDDDSWVREDVVQVNGMCRTLPQATTE